MNDTTREIMTNATGRLRTLLEDATNIRAQALDALMALHGFERTTWNITAHPTTGIQVATQRRGYRLAFGVPHAPNSMGLIDLPADIEIGVVEYIAEALHRKAAA